MANGLGVVEIDLRDTGQSEIALAFLGAANFALDGIAGAKPEAADDRRRDVDIVGSGEVIGLRRAEESEAVVQHLNGARPHDLDAVIGLDLEDREHQVLLAHRRCALDPHFLGHCDQVGGGFLFQFFQMHGNSLFLGSWCSSWSNWPKAEERQDAARVRERTAGFIETGRGRSRFEVCLATAPVNQR